MKDKSILPADIFSRIALVFGSATAVTGLLGIAGLATGNSALRSFFPGFQTMAFSTALLISLFGSILIAASLRPFQGMFRNAILSFLAVVAVAEVCELLFSIRGMHFLIEPYLVQFADTVFGRATSAISSIACLLFILAAVALFCIVLDTSRPSADPREKDIAGLTGLFITLAAITVITGYIYRAPYLDGTTFPTIALPTAIAFTFMGIAITAAAGRSAVPARYFTGTTTTAYLLRAFVPIAITIIVIQALFHDVVDLFFKNSQALLLSVSIVVFSVITGIVIMRVGRRAGAALDEEEAKRKSAEEELVAANEELLSSNEELTAMGEELRAGVEKLTRSEQALTESRLRLERTQEMARLGSWDLDLVNNRLSWSDEVYRIFGMVRGEFPATYEAFVEAVHPEDRALVNEAYARSLQDGSSTYEIDHRIVRKDTGKIRYVHEKCEHIRDGTGRIVRSTGMVHDITGRKEAEIKLNQVIASWNVTFNAMNDRICLLDLDGSVLRCNESMQILTGMAPEVLTGMKCHEILHHSAAFVEECPFQAMLKTGRRETLELEVGKRWFVVSADPVFDTSGAVTGAVHVMHDVTEQRRAQQALVTRNEELAAVEEELRQNVDELARREHDLRETGQYLENLIEYANAPIIVWDPQFRITRFNRAFERLTGRPAVSVIGQPLDILFPVDTREASHNLILKTVSGVHWDGVEIPILHAHGNVRTVLWNSATLFKPDGRTLSSVIAQGQDITERKNAEYRLEQALASWKVTFDAMNDFVCLIDRDGRIELCNEGLSRFLGLPMEKITGHRCDELLGISGTDAARCPVDAMLRSGKRESTELALGDRWVFVTADPIRNSAGEITGGVQIIRDITARRQAEEALKESEGRYRNILDNIPDAFIRTDMEGVIVMASPSAAHMFGFGSAAEMVGLQILTLYKRPEDGLQLNEELQKQGKVPEYETDAVRKDGSPFSISCSAQLFFDDRGRVLGVESFIRDVTVHKHLEREREQSLKEKEVLLKEIHHRVKNNIQVISSILNLQSRQAKDQSVRDIFRETQNKVKGIALIHEKLYRNKSLSKIDFAEYLRDISRSTFQSYNVDPRQIGLRLDLNSVALDIDKALPLSLMITELLSNALKHAFPGGRKGEISIGLRQDGRNLVLLFSDNGVGLPESVTFDEGATLGMGLIAGLANQIGGTMTVDRTDGTGYRVTFPVSDDEKALPGGGAVHSEGKLPEAMGK